MVFESCISQGSATLLPTLRQDFNFRKDNTGQHVLLLCRCHAVHVRLLPCRLFHAAFTHATDWHVIVESPYRP